MPVLPRGIYLWNNIDQSKAASLKRLRDLGYHIVVLDDEGLLYYNDKAYAGSRLSEAGISQVDYLLAPSPSWAQLVQEYLPAYADRVIVTGNPRLDLMRPAFRGVYQRQVDAHRARFGRFVLVNTNTISNVVSKRIQAAQYDMSGAIKNEADRQWIDRFMEYDRQKLASFHEMVCRLAVDHPSISIVLRPHPVEDFDQWRAWVRPHPNVTVLHEGSVYSWALAALAVVHNSCTTGLESHLLGRTVFSYRPVRSEYDHEVPNSVSEEVNTLDDLSARIGQVIAEADSPAPPFEYRHRDMLESRLGALEGPFAFERILEVFNRIPNLPLSAPPSPLAAPILKERVKEMIRVIAQRSPALGGKLFGEIHLDFWRYHHQAFGTIPLKLVRQRVSDLGRIHAPLAGVEVRSLMPGLFTLQARS